MNIKDKIKSKKVKYGEDCARIKYNLEGLGYSVTMEDCQELWYQYSQDRGAGWLALPDSDVDLESILYKYLN